MEVTAAQWAMAAFGLNAATTVMGAQAAAEQADATNTAAWNNYYANKALLDQQAKEIVQDANNQQSERAIQAMVEQGKLRAIAGESGVAGNSIDRWIQDSQMQESKDVQSIQTNKSNRIKQNRQELKGQYARAQGTSNEARSKVPTALGVGLQIAGAGASAYAGYKKGS